MISEWLGIPAAFIAWGFALYVFVVAPPTRGARFLVAMLFVDGLVFFFDPIQRAAERLENDALFALSGVGHSTD
jgi:hypothetical protein